MILPNVKKFSMIRCLLKVQISKALTKKVTADWTLAALRGQKNERNALRTDLSNTIFIYNNDSSILGKKHIYKGGRFDGS
mmetsp:Transcript_15768/g.20981  ORF Transcript_15768/g.20981 Transcript_15768/m.20981 type:complete len:80 (-) Transcript_15768:1855-2094(-)